MRYFIHVVGSHDDGIFPNTLSLLVPPRVLHKSTGVWHIAVFIMSVFVFGFLWFPSTRKCIYHSIGWGEQPIGGPASAHVHGSRSAQTRRCSGHGRGDRKRRYVVAQVLGIMHRTVHSQHQYTLKPYYTRDHCCSQRFRSANNISIPFCPVYASSSSSSSVADCDGLSLANAWPDPETDALIQEAMKEGFGDCSILCIAHR